MAIPAAIVAAGISAAAAGGQAVASGKMNKKTLAYNRETRDMSRAWALEDWNRVNEYNSPAAQMQRFKDAGLNPNLIYGQQTNADAVAKTEMQPWKPETPNYGAMATNAISTYQDMRVQDQQLVNLKMMEQNMKADNVIKLIEAANMTTQGESSKFDLSQKQRLAETSIKQAQATLEGSLIQNRVALSKNEMEIATNASNLREATERILSSRMSRSEAAARIKNINANTNLTNLDAKLRARGIYPGDPGYLRVIDKLVGDGGIEGAVRDFKEGTSQGDVLDRDVRPEWLQKLMGDKPKKSIWKK